MRNRQHAGGWVYHRGCDLHRLCFWELRLPQKPVSQVAHDVPAHPVGQAQLPEVQVVQVASAVVDPATCVLPVSHTVQAVHAVGGSSPQ